MPHLLAHTGTEGNAEKPRIRCEPTRRRSRSGSAIIEFSLIAPWYIFLFIGAFDFGFFIYSLNATQTAARQGAFYCAASSTAQCADSSSSTQCGYALSQLKMLPNVGASLTTCGTSTSVTSSAPVAVVTTSPLTSGNSPDGLDNSAVGFTVVYLTPQLIPIPGLLPGQLTITRTVKMKFRT
jgi:Flp pilus assembly protein TadG